MNLTAEELQEQIPWYLTQDQKIGFIKALNEFPNCNYYTARFPEDMLQGDGWTTIEMVRFEDGKRDKIKGIVLSNTCDIDPNNQRFIPPKITFAPIMLVSAYATALERSGMTQQQITDHLNSVRAQHITTMFHLPKGGALDDEHIALLEDLHTIPYTIFEQEKRRTKIFTLSQVGFYLFLMKLSIHFCRFHENVAR